MRSAGCGNRLGRFARGTATHGRSAARSLIDAFDDPLERRTAVPAASDVVQSTGRGLTAVIAGQRLVVGSPDFIRSQDVRLPETLSASLQHVLATGSTPVLVAVDGRAVAVIGVGDPIRADAAACVAALQHLGHQIHVLSGDHPAVVARVAHELGIPGERVLGAATPEQKVAYVRNLVTSGNTVMVGDGINDTAALAAATVGIAVHGGAEACLATADVYLGCPGLSSIVDLMRAAQITVRTIHRSLAASLCYNLLAGALAMAGVIGPLTAAVLMPISSFTVVALAMASRTFGERP